MMERYLTEKARRGRWWDIPVLAASGLLTVVGIKVVADSFARPVDDLFVAILAAAIFLGLLSLPIWFYLRRRRRQADARALAKCFAESGQSSLTYGAIQRRTGIRDAEGRLQKLLGLGFMQNVTLDAAHDMARLDVVVPREAAKEEAPPTLDTGNAEFNETLRQIRELNDRIDDGPVSRKIYRIEELTGGVFKLIAEHPDKGKDARRFIQYYLPATMKLLEAYSLLEKQRYQGENITASRQQIERVLDTMIGAIERQQDRMFRAEAMDVEAEITVLETLMAADGLTGPEHGLKL